MANRSEPAAEPVEAKFVAAWGVFAQTCGQYLAPEATYQAWFAHYLISQFGVDRVAREPGIKHKHFNHRLWSEKVGGSHVRLDAVVTKSPGVHLRRYSGKRLDSDTTGLDVLCRLAVISELKVAATTGDGLSHTEVARDVWKLSLLLTEFERTYPKCRPPLAFACVLDNHPTKRYSWHAMERAIERLGQHPAVKVLTHTSDVRPSMTVP